MRFVILSVSNDRVDVINGWRKRRTKMIEMASDIPPNAPRQGQKSRYHLNSTEATQPVTESPSLSPVYPPRTRHGRAKMIEMASDSPPNAPWQGQKNRYHLNSTEATQSIIESPSSSPVYLPRTRHVRAKMNEKAYDAAPKAPRHCWKKRHHLRPADATSIIIYPPSPGLSYPPPNGCHTTEESHTPGHLVLANYGPPTEKSNLPPAPGWDLTIPPPAPGWNLTIPPPAPGWLLTNPLVPSDGYPIRETQNSPNSMQPYKAFSMLN